jgi:hypothetical protein
MSALVTDQFRILNATNFINSIENNENSYYVFVGLPNPQVNGFGRDPNWDRLDIPNPNDAIIPNPTDNLNYLPHYGDTSLFGKKITTSNVRRVVKRVDWSAGTRYDMYRHDYSIQNQTPITNRSRLYDSNYYVMNSQYQVYICIDNGSSGINTSGNQSKDEPLFTDLEPSKAGESDDGYLWKYLFTIAPSDIVKFDSTEYISLPNSWETSTNPQIVAVRENGDSTINENQIKKIYIENPGKNYISGEVDILGNGSGGRVFIDVNENGEITDTIVTSGGKNYTYGIVDLGPLQPANTIPYPAKLIPIIPPSRGHGFDLYRELGADKILVYARFDDSTKDYPVDTKFAQIGIVKNPTRFISTEIFSDNQYSGLYSAKIISNTDTLPTVGEKITQSVGTSAATAYVASYDTDTKVLKYFKDRSLYFNPSLYDQTDYISISQKANANIEFSSTGGTIVATTSGFNGTVDSGFSGVSTVVNNKIINLGVEFTNGLANPEINKESGDIIYIDNRPLVSRNLRQKEDIKIILEF